MNLEQRSGQVAFRPRARLLKLIGAELISDDVVAITELVKNAHDADARKVTISFNGVTQPGGSITVADDGHGMRLDTLLDRWMVPASSSKTGPGKRLTALGRRVLGEKGVGRFAADKLASQLELVSRCADSSTEVQALFDWDQFDTDSRMLSEVKNRWQLRPATMVGHGTVLRMTGLRSFWNERMFRRLSTRLSRLRSPFRGKDGFAIRIESDEFPQYAGEPRVEFLELAPYQVDVKFDGKDGIELGINGDHASRLPWKGSPLECGPVRVRIFAFDLETEAIAKIGPRMEVRAWLREWSGVSIYRDGFRIWPYGEPHDDWLRLDQRRVNNPVTRLSNNQVVGFVEISADRNPELRDQTNREGLIHNAGFEDLRRLLYFVLQALEGERQAVRHPIERRAPGNGTGEGTRGSIAGVLEKVASKAPAELAGQLQRLAERLRQATAREEGKRRHALECYSDLAGLGQVAVSLGEAMRPLLARIRSSVLVFSRAIGGKGNSTMRTALLSMEDALSTADQRIALLKPMEGVPGGRRRTIDVLAELETSRRLLAPLLASRGIALQIDKPGQQVLRVDMRPEVFARLVHILVMNSLEWLDGVSEPRIRISAALKEEYCEVIFSDNGPGVSPAIEKKAFEPLISGKEGGRGMGLAIARDIVDLHGGKIELLIDLRRRGTNIKLLMPRKRSRATIRR